MRDFVALTRRSLLKRAAATGTLTLAAPAVLRAQTKVLRMSSWLPPSSIIYQNLVQPWAEEIGRLTQGRVTVEVVFPPMGPPPATQSMVVSGDMDIGYALHGYTPDLFQRALVGQFSFLGDAYSASHAFNRVYMQLLNGEAEHDGMTLLGVFQHGPGAVMLREGTIRTPEDFQGKRIRSSGGYISALLEDLGAENVPMSPLQIRDALIDGTIDGCCLPYEGALVFQLIDQVSFVSMLPGGYYNATWFLGMSNQAAGSLDPADLEVIRRYSSETVHALAAKAFDYADYIGLEELKKAGVVIEDTPPELTEHIRSVATGYEERWIAEMAETGYDGERALAFTRRITGGN